MEKVKKCNVPVVPRGAATFLINNIRQKKMAKAVPYRLCHLLKPSWKHTIIIPILLLTISTMFHIRTNVLQRNKKEEGVYREKSCREQNQQPSNTRCDDQCVCKQVYLTRNDTGKISLKSACSDYSTIRGSNQKVISYSLFGELNSIHFDGIQSNLDGLKKFYPGFTMRVYHDYARTNNNNNSTSTEGMKQLCDMFCRETILDLCDVFDIGNFGDISGCDARVWRFLPMADPLVTEWHSRDLDSTITQREQAAVDDWRDNSNATFHIMRDHPQHGVQILGGMFGSRADVDNNNKLEERMSLVSTILSRSIGKTKKERDQQLLAELVWPLARTDMVAHDSYTCQHLRSPFNRAFPTRRLSSEDFTEGERNNFVGSTGGMNISIGADGPCPEQCRPREHMNWILC